MQDIAPYENDTKSRLEAGKVGYYFTQTIANHIPVT